MINVIFSDVHACYHELVSLLHELGFRANEDEIHNPHDLKLWFIGDLLDRGEYPAETILLFYLLKNMGVLEIGAVGNHDERIYGSLLGWPAPARLGGLPRTLEQLSADMDSELIHHLFLDLFHNAPKFTYLQDEKLVLTHGSVRPSDLNAPAPRLLPLQGQVTPTCKLTYGETDGELDDVGRSIRTFEWVKSWYNRPEVIVFGHNCTQTFAPEVYGDMNIVGLDTGCVFGKQLTAYVHEWSGFLKVQATHARDDNPAMIRQNGREQLAKEVPLVSQEIFDHWITYARKFAETARAEVATNAHAMTGRRGRD